MTMYYKASTPGVMLETGFGQEQLGVTFLLEADHSALAGHSRAEIHGMFGLGARFGQASRPKEVNFGIACMHDRGSILESRFDNMVLEIWSDPEITAKTGYEYTRSIQFQCIGSERDGITFTGINFLSRVPIVEPFG